MNYFKDRRDRGESKDMFSLQAFLPLSLSCSLLAIFSRQFFACALLSERLDTRDRLPSVAKVAQGRGSISLLRSRSGRRRELA